MGRKYHRYVGGRAQQAELFPPKRAPEISAGVLSLSALKSVPPACCPDVPPWEHCEHTQGRASA